LARFVLRRLAQLIPVLIAASIVLFLALHILPGDPARRLLGIQASEQAVAAKRHELGLDRGIAVQYWDWVSGFWHGNLGQTYASNQPVAELVRGAFPVTAQLVVYALLLSIVLALPMALISVRRPGGAIDTLLTAVTVVSTSVPAFVWGLGFILVVSLSLQLLPSSGYVSPLSDPLQAFKSLAMPVVALALPSVGTIARVARASLLDIQDDPYLQFARSKGISARRLALVHSLKAAAVPIIVICGTEFAYILGDAVVVETIFALPGMGKLMIDAFLQRDYPIIQGVALVYTVLVVLASLTADTVSAEVDPRMRRELQPA
jgi:peptide/nickel transport system permease protein